MSIGLGRMEMGRVFFVQSFVESVLKIRKRSIVKICRGRWLHVSTSVLGFYPAKNLEGIWKYARSSHYIIITSCDIFIRFRVRSVLA